MFLHAPPHLQQLLSMSREKNERLTWLHSRVHWLDSYNATLVTRLEKANARVDQVTPWEARIRGLEQELARATGERDAAQEAEAHEAELLRAKAALEQRDQALETKEAEHLCKETELQRKEIEHQREKATVATLTTTSERRMWPSVRRKL